MRKIRTISQLLDAMKRGERIQRANVKSPENKDTAHFNKNEGQCFCVSLAGHCIRIHSQYDEVYHLCADYLCDDVDPDITINIDESDIAYERKEATKDKYSYSNSYLETLAVYRKISIALLEYDIFLMHGAVIAEGDNAFLFTAKSGTGKTTHIRKWLDRLEAAYVVNGDKPLIKVSDSEVFACGTPWCGKEHMGRNTMVPLRAIVLMERGENNSINEISFSDAFISLLQQIYQPEESEKMKKVLRLFSTIKGRVRIYKFIFNNMKDDAFEVAYNALTKGNS